MHTKWEKSAEKRGEKVYDLGRNSEMEGLPRMCQALGLVEMEVLKR